MNQPPPTLLVLGARGRIGAAAVQAFADAGWQVVAQARRVDASAPTSARVRWISPSLDDTDALAREAAGAQAVLYAVNVPYTQWSAQALPLARAGMAVAERLQARFLLPGNVYNFGEPMPDVLAEDTPQRPTTRKGEIRVALERELEERAAAGRLRCTVLRAGDFYGGGPGSWFDLVIAKTLREGKLVYPGPTDVAHAWAYLPDLARAFVAVASPSRTLAPPAFERLHFEGHTLTGAQLLGAIEAAAQSLGFTPPRGWRHSGLPWPLLRVGGLVVPMWRELAEMAYLWRVPHRLDGRALERAVGPLPGTPVADAMRATVQSLLASSPART